MVEFLIQPSFVCGLCVQVNISELGLVTQSGKVVWGKLMEYLFCGLFLVSTQLFFLYAKKILEWRLGMRLLVLLMVC